MNLQTEEDITVIRPKSLAELDAAIDSAKGTLTYVAGGTDVMVQAERWQAARFIVDLTSIAEISAHIVEHDGGLLIGAAVPISDIASHPLINGRYPILAAVCRQIGSVQIQNRATLGGNIANASPAADSLPVLNVLAAELWIGPKSDGVFHKRPVEQIMKGPGQTVLESNQYIAYIFLPATNQNNQQWYFRKVGQRTALAISKVSLAVIGWIQHGRLANVRISAGSVTARVDRARHTETLLIGRKLTDDIIDQARQSLMREVKPITDIRSTSDYRTRTCGELLREALYRIK